MAAKPQIREANSGRGGQRLVHQRVLAEALSRPYGRRPGDGLFSALYALYYVGTHRGPGGFPPLPDRVSRLSCAVVTILPFGVVTGMILLASQALARRTRSLRDSEERHRTLMEASPDGIIATDLSGTIFMCNRRAAEIHGYATRATSLEGWPEC